MTEYQHAAADSPTFALWSSHLTSRDGVPDLELLDESPVRKCHLVIVGFCLAAMAITECDMVVAHQFLPAIAGDPTTSRATAGRAAGTAGSLRVSVTLVEDAVSGAATPPETLAIANAARG